jgi:hypothetical protein
LYLVTLYNPERTFLLQNGILKTFLTGGEGRGGHMFVLTKQQVLYNKQKRCKCDIFLNYSV